MPSKNMIKKGKRRQTVKPAYRAHRDQLREAEELGQATPEAGSDASAVRPAAEASLADAGHAADAAPIADDEVELEFEDGVRSLVAGAGAAGKRLDAYLARALPEISRARVQLLIDHRQVRVDGEAAKASHKLAGGERIEIQGEPQPAPLKAEPEDIPLRVVYEDDDLAVIDKPAGMMVHAGAGDAEHNRGTLVNALLFHFGKELSAIDGGEGGVPRPGIVHRLDRETSGLIVVAKNDAAHRRLAEMFASRTLRKVYIALVQGTLAKDEGTVDLPIARDPARRVRMTTKRSTEQGARAAVSHWRVLERIGSAGAPGPLGAYTLVEVHIETGRTHQIRVHMAALGHPVVGDTLYGAAARLKPPTPESGGPHKPVRKASAKAAKAKNATASEPTLPRNFLHAAELRLPQPRTGKPLDLRSPLPAELEEFLARVRGTVAAAAPK